jgi:hypothetical protein
MTLPTVTNAVDFVGSKREFGAKMSEKMQQECATEERN